MPCLAIGLQYIETMDLKVKAEVSYIVPFILMYTHFCIIYFFGVHHFFSFFLRYITSVRITLTSFGSKWVEIPNTHKWARLVDYCVHHLSIIKKSEPMGRTWAAFSNIIVRKQNRGSVWCPILQKVQNDLIDECEKKQLYHTCTF